MTQHERELSNLSYTNKDFQTIYPELLDLAKKISYKWNPVESDESDPGVVLLKLAALMTDKLNYNIDKNILELYPLSVTQDTNARQLFDQCGYCMRYYQSATMDVSFSMTNEPEVSEADIAELAPNSAITLEDLKRPQYTRSYTLPMFTMVSDIDNNIVYTTLEDAILKSDSTLVTVPAIQGIVQEYTINGQSLITASNLDYNNRLYFTETDIAENGIFITNESGYNYSAWKKVDNLILQPLNTPCYKFGLTEDGSMCYIEFPTDIDSLIGGGIRIRYIRTRGMEGNIGRKRIAQFYVDTSATRRFSSESAASANVQSVTVTSDNIAITNSFASTDGKDPETIEDAYRNYQRVKSTFDTLVSLKDYTDFLYTNENYSNGFVCDRTNDLQSAYKIVENKGTYTRTHTMTRKLDGKDELTAFDLRVYGLTYVDNATTAAGYTKSFTVIEDSESLATDWYQIKADTLNIKSIQHDFQNYICNRPIMFKNKFPIKAKIIPQYKLIDAQKQDVLSKVETALCSALNSRQLVFGEEVEYDVVYDTIMNCDPRIKALILDDFSYETYVVYKNSDNVISELRIDSGSVEPTDSALAKLWHDFRVDISARCVLAGVSQLLNSKNDFTYTLEQKNPRVLNDVAQMTTILQFPIATNDTTDGDYKYFQTQDDETYFAISEILQENENLVLTAPNLINDQTYSSYCKFIHNISELPRTEENIMRGVVTSGEEYRLKEHEFIVLFWKTEDDDAVPYSYIKYDHNSDINIISPTFTMKVQKNPDDLPELPIEKLRTLPSGKGTTQFLTMPDGSLLTDYIAKLQGSTYVLTGSNTIYTKKPNAITITDATVGTRNVYWILNKNSKVTMKDGSVIDSAVLFEDTRGKDVNDAGNTYILQSGEYFMYSNASRTHLTMLGSGTKITRTESGLPWRVDAIDYDEFIATGVEYLDTKWFEVPTGTDVIATEMLFHQLGPGNRLKLVTNKTLMPNMDANGPSKIIFMTDGISQGNGKVVKDTTTGGVKFEQNFITLHEYSVSFIDEDGNETQLASRHEPDLAWDGYSLLNIDVSPSIPQELKRGHTIVLYNSNGEIVQIFTSTQNTDSEFVDENIDKYQEFLTSKELSLTGGRHIDATSLGLGGVVQPVSVYMYEKNEEGIGDSLNVIYNDTQACVYAGSGILTATFPVCLLAGKYVLPMTIDSDDLTSATLSLEDLQHHGVTIHDFSFDMSELHQKGTHYLYFELTEPETLIATLTVNNSKDDTTITFDSPYKYAEAFDESMFTDIAEKVAELDVNHIFNYTNEVKEDMLIKDPLQSDKFFDNDHVFNPYTIGMWQWTATTNTKESDIFIVDKIK